MTSRRLFAALAFAFALAAIALPTPQIDDPCPRGVICINTQVG